jgi:hypothetical protein
MPLGKLLVRDITRALEQTTQKLLQSRLPCQAKISLSLVPQQ